jgi:DNA-directed RNA polymerase subunit H (RpoH/RPB5)
MTEAQYNIYQNVITFAKDWRKYTLQRKPLDLTAFRSAMQNDQYALIECLNKKQNREVLIYIFDKDSKYVSSSQDLKRLLKKIKNSCDVIFITYTPFKTYGKKAIALYNNTLTIYTYLQEIFEMILPYGPLCYPHRILSREEVLRLCNEELMCYLMNLPKIFDEDPQCIWIGASSGEVVEIKMLSDIAGEVIHYRSVVPKSGRVIFIKEADPLVVEKSDDVELEDDELEEHREMNAPEDDILEDGLAENDEQADHEKNDDDY